MGLLAALLVPGGGRVPRPLRFLLTAARHPRAFLSSLSVRRWSERSVILLVMQSLDNSLRIMPRGHRLGPRLRSTQGHGEAESHLHPGGSPGSDGGGGGGRRGCLWHGEQVPAQHPHDRSHPRRVLHRRQPADRGHRRLPPRLRPPGAPRLPTARRSSANLGVNPSLTIATMTERAMSLWPNRGDGTRVRRWARRTAVSRRYRRALRRCRSAPLPHSG